MNAWADADHPRGRFGRFKAKFRTEPKDGLDDDRWASSPTSDITGWMLWQTAEGELHRVGGPAVIWVDGYQEWYLHGKRHRIDGPAVTDGHGYEAWYLNGEEHRKDGPAVTDSDGRLEWWEHGHLHRLDGPAIAHPDGTLEWWEHGVRKPPEIEAALTMVWLARTPNKA